MEKVLAKKHHPITPVVIVIVVVLVAGFFGGYQYAKSKTADYSQRIGDFADLSLDEMREMRQRPGGGMGRLGGMRAGGSFINGEIISIDEGSITVKLSDGSTKLVLLTDGTEMSKPAEMTRDDLSEGLTVMVGGDANDDGSLTALLVQLRPEWNQELDEKENK